MPTIKIALIQMSMAEDKEENLAKALASIKTAAKKGAVIVALPELFSSRYFAQTDDRSQRSYAEELPNATTKALASAARENNIVIIGGSLYEKTKEGKYYNTAVIFNSDGNLRGTYRKVHIPHDPNYYEKSYFEEGAEFKVFHTKHATISVLICYDQWFPEAARICALNGAQIIFYPTAIGWFPELKKLEPFSAARWERDQCSHASMNGIYVAAINRVGVEGKMNFWGGSFIADPFGNVIARAGDKKDEILFAEIDLAKIEASQEGWGFLKNRRPETYGALLKGRSDT